MILARVTGNVVGTIKHPSFHARALMVVQPIDPDGSDLGARMLAVDHAQSGPGDRVLVLSEGSGIRQILNDPTSPIRALIVAVVDAIDHEPPTG